MKTIPLKLEIFRIYIRWLLWFFFLFPGIVFSQRENNNWYFGNQAGISFNSTPPAVLTNSNAVSWYETACVSDSAGNLLFYTNGVYIYNQNHLIMMNGYGFLGGSQAYQSLLVCKIPNNDSIYYLFTAGNYSVTPHLPGLYYSQINIKLDNGLGGVIEGAKNLSVSGGELVFDRIHATRHRNNQDIWVVTIDTLGNYLAFLVTKYGINPNPVISQSQTVNHSNDQNQGVLKLSQDGKNLVLVNFYDSLIELSCFDNQTGMISSSFTFSPVVNSERANLNYGAEFSPDARFLYINATPNNGNKTIFQYETTYDDSVTFMQSQVEIGTHLLGEGMQLGNDGKIYQSLRAMDSLNIIHTPNEKGTDCNFEPNAISLQGYTCGIGLPQLLQRYKAYIHHDGRCRQSPVAFSADIWPPADTTLWNFGDPTSGTADTSSLANPFHLYATPGTYTVTLYVRHNDNRTDTSRVPVTILASPQPSAGPDQSVCTGVGVTFDAGACTGCSYLWSALPSGIVVGNTQTLTTSVAGVYEVAVTGPSGCTGRDTVQLSVADPPVITNDPAAKTICSGESTAIVLSSTVTGTTCYWTATLTSGTVSGFAPGEGTTIDQVLTSQGLSAGVVTYMITPVAGSCTGTTVSFPVTVNPGDSAKISISASANPVCSGTPVTFTAEATNAGTTPSYQWFVNGAYQFTGSPVFTYTPSNGDQIVVQCQSSIVNCISGNPATSNIITLEVNPLLPVSVSISASANPVCSGTPVTFTAIPFNGGSNPVFQWFVNGVNQFTGSPVFTYTPSNGDQIIVHCQSSIVNCVTGNPAISAPVSVTLIPSAEVTFSACFDTITTVNAKPFRLKGGLPLGGTYSGPGVNSATAIFTPSIAGPGTHTITYTYTNAHGCSSISQSVIQSISQSIFSCGSDLADIRDGKVYPTVQIGSQCWMQKNLDYGTTIPTIIHQTDNCIAEQYLQSSIVNPGNRKSIYQWDELMRYESAPGSQGLCPPGWHVPTESDWTILFNFYKGASRAGEPMLDTFLNGFKATPDGVLYQNATWSFTGFAVIYWSSSPIDAIRAWSHGMNTVSFSVSSYPALKADAFPVRCVRD